jgi:RHS repeat-associated protein
MMQVTLDATTGAMAPAEVTDPITRNAYTPYGAVRGADNLTISKGWLNQVTDEASTGLVYLNARYYDTGTSRFVSPDPKMNPADPRTLDAFRYADNNPVSFTDASGLGPVCTGLSGTALANCNAYGNTTANYMTGAKGTSQAGTTHVVQATAAQKLAAQQRAAQKAALDARLERELKQIAEDGKFNWADAAKVGGQGLVNFGGGFVNGAADLVNVVADGAVNAIIPGCQLNALGAGAPWCISVPDIPDIPIWGDYDTYRWSSYAGSLSFQASTVIAGDVGAFGGGTQKVFWAGGEAAKVRATEAAIGSGAKTIGMTPVGRALEGLGDLGVPWSRTQPLWKSASAEFASRASGDVTAFINVSKANMIDSIYYSTERFILQSKLDVALKEVFIG